MTGEENYLELLSDVMENGVKSDNRTATPTRKVFGRFWTCEDVVEDFPLLTTKRVHTKSIIAELIWFLSGSTNVKDLQAMGCTIWDEWADPNGELGPVYGKQWRNWDSEWYASTYEIAEVLDTTDQIADAIGLLVVDPNSRRNIVSAWNVADLPKMKLMPCHYAFQLQVTNGELNMLVNMRSIDIFLGLPFNIASYALLLRMFAQVTGYRAKRLCFSLGDLHLYENHRVQADTQRRRHPRQAPRVLLEPDVESIFDFRPEHVKIESYDPHSGLKGDVAV